MLGPIRPGVHQRLAIRNASSGAFCGGLYLFLRFGEISPPRGLPEWPAQNLLRSVAADFQTQIIRVDHHAVVRHDAREYGGLLEERFELRFGCDRFLGNLALSFLSKLLVGDVAGDLGSARYAAVCVLDR